MASQSVVEEIKQKIDIVELVGSYISLKHAGKYFKANCPFHQEKTPSFVVSPDIQRWHCFGSCHEGGDIFNFVMKWEGISFAEALKLLADKAGVPLVDQAKSSGYHDAEVDNKTKILSINVLAAKYYTYILQNTENGATARAYLAGRELSETIIKTFQLGYAPEAWTNLRDFLHKKGFEDQVLMSTGLFIQGERGIYDRFRGRLMFPIQNARGQVVGFSGRLIKQNITEKDGGKYINTPETLVYHKRESLFGIYHAKDDIRKANTAIVVEGEFDMLTPYAKGITNIVAIKGSAFTEDQLKTIRRYCNRLTLALDNDEAGFDALRKSTVDAQQFGFELYVCTIPEGKDPDDAARKNTAQFKEAVRHPIPVYDHIMNTLFARVDEQDPFSKKHFIEGVVPYIDMIENPIVRTHYIQKAAGLLKSTEENVLSLLRDYKQRNRKPRAKVQESEDGIIKQQDRTETFARRILSIILTVPIERQIISEILTILEADDFAIPSHRLIYDKYREFMDNNSKYDPNAFCARLNAELRPVYDELYLFASTIEQNESKYLLRITLEYKKLLIAQTIQKLSQQPEEENDDTVRKLNADMVLVEKRLKLL